MKYDTGSIHTPWNNVVWIDEKDKASCQNNASYQDTEP